MTEVNGRTSVPTDNHDSARRRRAPILMGLVAIAIIVVGVLARGSLGGTTPEGEAGPNLAELPPPMVDVDSVRTRNVVDAVRATGRIEAVQFIELRPDAQGRITRIMFREGQPVAAGTPLLQIDDALLRAQAERAAADQELAEQQLERVRKLRADNAASPADLERAEAAARSADAALSLLRLQIARTTVRAPFAGLVGQRLVSLGDYVTSADPLLTLQTVDPQRAVVEVPERYAGQLKPGQSIEFSVAAQPERVFEAEVEFIDAVVQPASRAIVVKARAANRDRALKPGMFIEARLATVSRSHAVVVPEDAVQPLRVGNVVWAVVGGKASRRLVQLGARTEGEVEILSGVKPGELVVVGGLERMGEGMLVAPQLRKR